MTDFAAQLRAIQEEAGRLAALLRGIDAGLPEEIEGTDESRTVSVQIDRAGVPVGVVVRDGWAASSGPGPEGLGDAVVRAAGAAAGARAQALDDLMRERNAAGAPPAVPPAPAVPVREPRMPMGELAEEAINALARVGAEPVAVTPPAGTGEAAGGAVSVTLAAGTLSACTVDERWAEGRSALHVTLALQQALEAARRSLEEARPAEPTSGSLDDLLGEAMAHLFAITGNAQEEVQR